MCIMVKETQSSQYDNCLVTPIGEAFSCKYYIYAVYVIFYSHLHVVFSVSDNGYMFCNEFTR